MRLSYRDVVMGLFLIAIPFLLPIFKFSDVNTLVAATSAVFAIVSGFFIADAMSNYLRLQTLIAEENAALMTLAIDVKKMDSAHKTVVYDAIDKYMIAQLEAKTLEHTSSTRQQVDGLDETLSKLKHKDSTLYDHILSAMEIIRTSRQEISLAAKRNLGFSHWTTLITLELVVITAVLALRDGELLMNIVVAAIIFSTYTVLILLREIDNNHLLEKKLSFENPRDVFHAIDKPPYYPSYSPKITRIPNENNEIRVGHN